MSKALTTTKSSELAVVAQRIDEIAATAPALFSQANSFSAAIQVAQTVQDLESLLTDDVMQPIMRLAGNRLGFLTDKPYPVDVVRRCFIEATVRGFYPVGNEWNIISGNFYPAQAGFFRRLTDGKSFPGLTDFRDWYDVPRMSEKGALIKCGATWIYHGKADKLECELAIRVNAGMGSDAIVGKAKRKLCKRVHDALLGVVTPDTDEDAITVESTRVPEDKPKFGLSPE